MCMILKTFKSKWVYLLVLVSTDLKQKKKYSGMLEGTNRSETISKKRLALNLTAMNGKMRWQSIQSGGFGRRAEVRIN